MVYNYMRDILALPLMLIMSAVKDIPTEDMTLLLKSKYATRLLYTAALGLVKSSIFIFYMRLDHRKCIRRAIHFLKAFTATLPVTAVIFPRFHMRSALVVPRTRQASSCT